MQIIFSEDDMTIRDVTPTPVAIIEHRGDRSRIGDTRQRSTEEQCDWHIAGQCAPNGQPGAID